VCVPGAVTGCYSGPAGTAGVGACRSGTRSCNAAGTSESGCVGEVLPAAESCLTTGDDNCDGRVNEGCVCAPGSTATCYAGPAGTQAVGLCRAGTKVCSAAGTSYGACVGEIDPVAESCSTAGDDNCDGAANEGCVCVPNATASCYAGPPGTAGVGLCRAGTKTCNAAGTSYGSCAGEIDPAAESCSTAGDDNCDGASNEGCVCTPNASVSCYSGPAGTAGVGLCKAGSKTCNAAGTAFGACSGEITPVSETCTTPGDDDCNGQVNEGGAGCVCAPNSAVSCYTGAAGTAGVGLCKAGTKTCNAAGTAFSGCAGEVTPVAESCATAADDNCNGSANEGCPAPTTYAQVQPIFQAKCAGCHAGGGSGGHNIATTYSDALLPSYYCAGKTKGACTIVRIKEGSMPAGRGCSGNPAVDSANSGCLSASQQALVQAWVDGGLQP
jgi:hypothetical protein